MNTPIEKYCPRCGATKPLNEFSIAKLGKYGRKSHCKTCVKIAAAIYREAHREEINAKHSAYVKTPRGKTAHNKWRRENPGKVRQYERSRKNKDERRTFISQWGKQHPEKGRRRQHVRRAVIKKLPNNFTEQDEQVALRYFDGRCAVCNRPPDFWHFIVMDHWIPLVSENCPGSVPENMVPLCHSKKGAPEGWAGCNNSKNDSDPVKWLTQKFEMRKANQIVKRIERFFEWRKHNS